MSTSPAPMTLAQKLVARAAGRAQVSPGELMASDRLRRAYLGL